MGALRQTRPACFVRRTRRAVSAPDDWHEYNPDLRTEQNGKAVQDALDYFSFKCGLGTRRYRFEASGVKTATEYTGDRQDMVQHANRHQIGANGDRVLRTKQGAVSGAALRFSQGRKSRSENRLSARGGAAWPALLPCTLPQALPARLYRATFRRPRRFSINLMTLRINSMRPAGKGALSRKALSGLRCPAFASGVAAPSQKTDRCPCSASPVSSAGRGSAAQPSGGP